MAEHPFPARTGTQTRAEIDQGLRSYMLGVYNYMALGVALTAAIVMLVASNPPVMAAVFGLRWVFFIAVLGLGFFAPRLIFSGNTALILPNNTSGSFVDLGSNLSSDFTPPLSAPGADAAA